MDKRSGLLIQISGHQSTAVWQLRNHLDLQTESHTASSPHARQRGVGRLTPELGHHAPHGLEVRLGLTTNIVTSTTSSNVQPAACSTALVAECQAHLRGQVGLGRAVFAAAHLAETNRKPLARTAGE